MHILGISHSHCFLPFASSPDQLGDLWRPPQLLTVTILVAHQVYVRLLIAQVHREVATNPLPFATMQFSVLRSLQPAISAHFHWGMEAWR